MDISKKGEIKPSSQEFNYLNLDTPQRASSEKLRPFNIVKNDIDENNGLLITITIIIVL